MNLSVLIAEDEPSIVMSLRFLMEKQGYDVRVVETGDAVMGAIEDRRPDVLLLDVMMPGRDGFEVLADLRGRSDWSSIRVIMLSAKGRDIDREKGLSLGADLPGRPVADYKRRIGPWLLWRAGPAKGGDARYWAAHADRLDEPVTLRLHPDGTADGVGPSGTRHSRFRSWKEDLRDA